jgi:hypothetical protein
VEAHEAAMGGKAYGSAGEEAGQKESSLRLPRLFFDFVRAFFSTRGYRVSAFLGLLLGFLRTRFGRLDGAFRGLRSTQLAEPV